MEKPNAIEADLLRDTKAPQPSEANSLRDLDELIDSARAGDRGALAGLSPPHQEALALREFDGESYQAIACASSVPIGTVMSRLHHARHRLAEQLAATFDVGALRAA